MAHPSDDELLKLIIEADDLLLKEGEDPRGRSIVAIQRVMAKLGHHLSVSPILLTNPPPLADKIRALHGSLCRRSDFAVGGLHGGIFMFMFRGVFARVTADGIGNLAKYKAPSKESAKIGLLRRSKPHSTFEVPYNQR